MKIVLCCLLLLGWGSHSAATKDDICLLRPATKGCEFGWESFKNNCYRLFEKKANWTHAEEQCNCYNGHLTSILDAQEQAFIGFMYKGRNWIGLTFEKGTGKLTWSDGKKVHFKNWHDREPTGPHGHGGEDCVEIGYWPSTEHSSPWNNWECYRLLPFICKKPKHGTSNCWGSHSAATEDDVCLLQPATKGCDFGWESFQNNCYRLFENKANWTQAEEQCKCAGGHLTSILDADEQAFITLQYDGRLWIGLSFEKDSGKATWTDGNKVGYTNWRKNQPDHYPGSRIEDCCEVGYEPSKENTNPWNNCPCSFKRPFICKKPKRDISKC